MSLDLVGSDHFMILTFSLFNFENFAIRATLNYKDQGLGTFKPPLYLKGSYVINHFCPVILGLFVCCSVFRYFRNCTLLSLTFCTMLGHHKGAKVTSPTFEKKGITNLEKKHYGVTFGVFCLYICIQLLKFHIRNKLKII